MEPAIEMAKERATEVATEVAKEEGWLCYEELVMEPFESVEYLFIYLTLPSGQFLCCFVHDLAVGQRLDRTGVDTLLRFATAWHHHHPGIGFEFSTPSIDCLVHVGDLAKSIEL